LLAGLIAFALPARGLLTLLFATGRLLAARRLLPLLLTVRRLLTARRLLPTR
jgi:hypothetical protein